MKIRGNFYPIRFQFIQISMEFENLRKVPNKMASSWKFHTGNFPPEISESPKFPAKNIRIAIISRPKDLNRQFSRQNSPNRGNFVPNFITHWAADLVVWCMVFTACGSPEYHQDQHQISRATTRPRLYPYKYTPPWRKPTVRSSSTGVQISETLHGKLDTPSPD